MRTERRKRKKYDEGFKREAIRLVEEGVKASHVERDLGICNGSVMRWKKILEEDDQSPFPGSGHQRPEQAELSRLRREVERLKRERDILKKATAIFAENQ